MSTALKAVELPATTSIGTPHQEDVTKESFDERFYLDNNPDVAAAVTAGRLASGLQHYERVGHKEHRKARFGDFQPQFYYYSYPMARQDIASGKASDLFDHYNRIGRHRGYLPNPSAPRPDNPSVVVSRFGGTWLDMANAGDMIEAKLEIGRITPEQAEMLRNWRINGYVVLKAALKGDILENACSELERAYSGKMAGLLFESAPAFGSRQPKPWQTDVNSVPAKALDMHFLSGKVRDAIFAPAITEFMELVFESRCLASQNLGFYLGSAQEGHQDTAYVAYTMPRTFIASWIALEDVTVGAGELFYYRGSHILEDFLYSGNYKTIHDCRRMTGGVLPGEVSAFVRSLQSRAESARMAKEPFVAKKGDVLLWHADLVHGGNPVSKEITRKSIVTHYCPIYAVPLYFEGQLSKIFKHGNNAFCTSVYPSLTPADHDPAMTI
jgi:phytanoyl-CoA hydroxylase